MLKKIIRMLSVPLGALLGVGAALSVIQVLRDYFEVNLAGYLTSTTTIIAVSATGLVFAVIAFFLSNSFADWLVIKMQQMEKRLKEMPIKDMMLGILGLIIGLILAFLIGQAVALIDSWIISITINLFLYTAFGILGVRVALARRDDIRFSFLRRRKKGEDSDNDDQDEPKSAVASKILDTCVIIDGRIVDIYATGFIEGQLVVPKFILSELRRISDSDDALKRNRGRRGLDVLARLQLQQPDMLLLEDTDYPTLAEVDDKVIQLAKDKGYTIITNDFNLNKLATVQGLKILNINDLSNAVKSVMLAGEEIVLAITKEGKESTQGIGYLDDGTMIVVEGGRRYLGETVNAVVTSILQTSAGRMIFAKIKE